MCFSKFSFSFSSALGAGCQIAHILNHNLEYSSGFLSGEIGGEEK